MYHKPFDDVITPNVFKELVKEAANAVYLDNGFLSTFVSGSHVIVTVYCYDNSDEDWEFDLDYDDWGKITGNATLISCEKEGSTVPYEFMLKLQQLIDNKKAMHDSDNDDASDWNFYDAYSRMYKNKTNSSYRRSTSSTYNRSSSARKNSYNGNSYKYETDFEKSNNSQTNTSKFSAFIDEFDKRLKEGPSREYKNYRLIGRLIGFFSACAVVVLAIIFLKGMIDASTEPKEPENAIHIDVDASYFKDKNCYEVQTFFVDKGFEDVSLKALKDMTFGWIYTEYAVSSVTIDGKDDFKSDKWYLPTTPVIISYHSYK